MRLDHVDRPDVAAALAGRTGPVILTCRAAWEGGRFSGSEEERRRILEQAHRRPGRSTSTSRRPRASPPTSSRAPARPRHRRVAPSLRRATRARSSRPTGICASSAQRWPSWPSRSIGSPTCCRSSSSARRRRRAACPAGDGRPRASRRGCWRRGFGTAGPTPATASRPGSSPPTHAPRAALPADPPGRALYGVVGNPVMHSLSPIMHNAGFAALGLNAVYLPLEARGRRRYRGLRARARLRGISITAPFKVTLMPFVDELDRRGAAASARSTPSWSATAAGSATTRMSRDFWRHCAGVRAARHAGVASSVAAARRGRWRSRSRDSGADVTVSRAARRGGAGDRGTGRRTGRRVSAAGRQRGTCSSTPRRLGRPRRPRARWRAHRSTAASSTTSSTQPEHTRCWSTRAPRGAGRSAASRCWSRRPSGSSRCGRAAPARGPLLRRGPLGGRPSAASQTRRRRHEADDIRRVRGAGPARHVRAGGQGDHGGPADAGLGLPEDCGALRLRVPVRERRRRRAGRALLVPRQGSVPRAARRGAARRPSSGPASTSETRRAVRAGAAPADGGVPVAVRAGPAALHRRRGRLHRLRRVADVRAGAAATLGRARPGPARTERRRRSRVHAVRHGAGVRSRQAPDPDHRQRAHHRRRGPRGAVPVRLREDSVPRARARAQPVAAGRASAAGARVRRQPDARGLRSRRAHDQGAHRRRRHLPGGAVAAVRGRRRRPIRSPIYRALRHVNPSPYMYFIRMGGLAIVGSSPEMLVRVEGPPRRDPSDCRHAAARHATRTRICGWPRS